MCVHILSSDYLGCRCPFKYVYVTSGSTMLWHGSCAMLYVKIYMSICVYNCIHIRHNPFELKTKKEHPVESFLRTPCFGLTDETGEDLPIQNI